MWSRDVKAGVLGGGGWVCGQGMLRLGPRDGKCGGVGEGLGVWPRGCYGWCVTEGANCSTLAPSLAEAEAAVKSLDGRWFGGKMIKAEVYDEAKFDNNDLCH